MYTGKNIYVHSIPRGVLYVETVRPVLYRQAFRMIAHTT